MPDHAQAPFQRAWQELSADALRNNVEQVRRQGPARIMAVVKANAYGHGMAYVARVLEPHVDAFAVASLEEALGLRRQYPEKPITLLSGFYAEDQLRKLHRGHIRPVIYNQQQLQWLLRAGRSDLPLALKLDSGMGRLGFRSNDFSRALVQLDELSGRGEVAGDILLMSHFACADEPGHPLNERQHRLFRSLAAASPFQRSFANSAAILSRPQDHYDQVRPGIMLYGASPLQGRRADELGLQPVMRLFARVLDIKHLQAGDSVGYGGSWRAPMACRVGVVSIGYGDGYPRVVSDGAQLAIDGKRYRLVGRVSMDSLAFLLEDDESVCVGTPVELWGETIPVDEVAAWAGTIAYELCCKVTPRVARFEVP